MSGFVFLMANILGTNRDTRKLYFIKTSRSIRNTKFELSFYLEIIRYPIELRVPRLFLILNLEIFDFLFAIPLINCHTLLFFILNYLYHLIMFSLQFSNHLFHFLDFL